MPNLFRAFVEGLGSKKLAAVVAAIVGVFLAPVAQKYLGLDPGVTAELIGGVLVPVVLYVLAQWHLDKVTGGQTTTAYRLTLGSAQAIEKIAKDGTLVDTIARKVIEAMQDAQPPGEVIQGGFVPEVKQAVAAVPTPPPAQP